MKDRVLAGFISGIMAGIAMNIVDWVGFLSGFHGERLLDWASVAIYGRLPGNLAELIFSQVSQIFFAGFLGIIFSTQLLKWTSGNYLFKGWLFGLVVWFGLYAISIAFQLPNLEQHTFNAVFSHFLSAAVYGLTLAYTLNHLDKIDVR